MTKPLRPIAFEDYPFRGRKVSGTAFIRVHSVGLPEDRKADRAKYDWSIESAEIYDGDAARGRPNTILTDTDEEWIDFVAFFNGRFKYRTETLLADDERKRRRG